MDTDPIRPGTLRDLAAITQPHCVSILMPAHATGAESRQDPIRLDNLLNQAADQLKARGLRRSEAETILKPAREVVDQDPFWQHQGLGLAIYLADGVARMLRLPDTLDESITVGPHFNIKPLLAAVASSEIFFVLALTERDARLFQGSRSEIVEVDEAGFPMTASEVVGVRDSVQEVQRQNHPGPTPGRADRMQGTSHGQGEGQSKLEADVLHFIKEVAEKAGSYLYQQEAPLVLAADDSLAGTYRQQHRRGQLLPEGIHGSPASLQTHQLRQKAWQIAEPLLRVDRSKLLNRFGTAAAAGKSAQGITDVVVAAATGKIDTLFFDPRACQPGRLSDGGTSASVTYADGSAETDVVDPEIEDLINRAVIDTLCSSGRAVPVASEPGTRPHPPKAILRY